MIEFHCLLDYVREHPHIDVKKGYLQLLRELTVAPDISNADFISAIEKIHKMGKIIIGVSDDEIICSGTILLEPKIIHGGKYVGHIEDIVVLSSWRGKGLGEAIIDHLKVYGSIHDCYKIILDCDENLERFYDKSGFSKKGLQMSLYL
jgi:glucosamine-phosphate N-acetyltransferase